MDGFKNTTKTRYSMGGSAMDGYSMGGYAKGGSKFGKVMSEFKAGTLHSGSKKGAEVTNPKQAVAIALSESRKAGAKFPVKKQAGGPISAAVRQQLETEINDMGSADRARALKMLGRAPAVVKKTTTVVAPAPKKGGMNMGGMNMGGMKKGGMTDIKQDKAMVKKAVHKHEAAMHPGKPMTKLRKGGMPC